jgi:hypothetical protein
MGMTTTDLAQSLSRGAYLATTGSTDGLRRLAEAAERHNTVERAWRDTGRRLSRALEQTRPQTGTGSS